VPVYEYVCTSCGERIDVRHSIASDGPTTCELCGGRMRKALSAPAIHFKGSGWAKKDANRAIRAGEKKASGDGAPETAPVTATADGGTAAGESKSAPKAETSAASEAKPTPPAPAHRPAKSSRPPARKGSGD
jgi:putative FmdB family regulatory protein